MHRLKIPHAHEEAEEGHEDEHDHESEEGHEDHGHENGTDPHIWLDPNLSIADGYDLWEITMKNGEAKQGIIGSETTGSITLRVYGGADEVLSRQDIQSLRSLGMSIMPSGMENLLSSEDMRDLLTFIKKLK